MQCDHICKDYDPLFSSMFTLSLLVLPASNMILLLASRTWSPERTNAQCIGAKMSTSRHIHVPLSASRRFGTYHATGQLPNHAASQTTLGQRQLAQALKIRKTPLRSLLRQPNMFDNIYRTPSVLLIWSQLTIPDPIHQLAQHCTSVPNAKHAS